VRITTAPGMGVPGVVGSREICIPAVDAARSESAELVAVVAHEAAHVERLDLFWLRLLGE
jgi:beta-lactamase regulating signal transducer with metallopeptidase domain